MTLESERSTPKVLDVSEDHDAPGGRRAPESRGPFWRVYELREAGKPARRMLSVQVAPGVRRNLRIPAKYATPDERARFAKGAAAEMRRQHEAGERERREAAEHTRAERDAGPTFAEWAGLWVSGELGRLYPGHVRSKRTAVEDGRKLERLRPVIGDVPMRVFRVEDAERAIKSLPADLAPATVRTYVMFIRRALALAVYPGKLLAANPLPENFSPRRGAPKARAFVYPAEDALLLACADVPLVRRVLYGVLAREGMRAGEALGLRWGDLDLDRGTVSLDTNKTDDPRTWALGEDVARALGAWRELRGGDDVPSDALVFTAPDFRTDRLAETFRDDLRAAGVDREILFVRTEQRIPIRVHDLRASFVTLALATGQTETWVSDRTGHKSSVMIATYKRAARTAAELGLGWFSALDRAIPELAACFGSVSPAPSGASGESVAAPDGAESAGASGTSEGGRSESRTRSQRIKSPLLCQLS